MTELERQVLVLHGAASESKEGTDARIKHLQKQLQDTQEELYQQTIECVDLLDMTQIKIKGINDEALVQRNAMRDLHVGVRGLRADVALQQERDRNSAKSLHNELKSSFEVLANNKVEANTTFSTYSTLIGGDVDLIYANASNAALGGREELSSSSSSYFSGNGNGNGNGNDKASNGGTNINYMNNKNGINGMNGALRGLREQIASLTERNGQLEHELQGATNARLVARATEETKHSNTQVRRKVEILEELWSYIYIFTDVYGAIALYWWCLVSCGVVH